MANSLEFRDYILDILAPLGAETAGAVTARVMFGGHGIFLDGLMFGLLASDALYLKADDQNHPVFAEAGAQAFRPFGNGRMVMRYYDVPADVMDDTDRLCEWARLAHGAAIRGRAAKPKRRRR